ncbi:MAG: undecaprenyl-phosphate glucose phosphotransferase [Planctomycetia bacterium]|nr:undecaprenyl-phosphate glucose phosphotransferase [Planctomycetia bacterium]
MFRRHQQVLGWLFLGGDLLATAAAWVAAYLVRFSLWPAPAGVPRADTMLLGLPWALVLAVVAYRICGLHRLHRMQRPWREALWVSTASGLLFLLIIAATFYRRDLYESRLALGLFFVLNATFGIALRRAMWLGLSALQRRGFYRGKALLVGSGRTLRLVTRTMARNGWMGLDLVGFVDRPDAIRSGELPYLGEVSQLAEIVERHAIEQVLVAMPIQRYGELPEIYGILSDVLVDVQLVPDIPNLSGMRARAQEIDGATFLALRERPICGMPKVAKRAMDLALGTVALLLLSPVLLALAVAIKLTSRGPVFYRQERASLGGQSFWMWKFRSMRADAERETGPVWAHRGDDRCTKLGRFMRKWGLDELPQLFNVLAGDMSLVGPRPERGVFIEKFRRQIPCYTQRHQVKAGITGWAQVNGWRGNTSLRRRVECDLYYICNWSLWLDLRILFLTFLAGFRHRNAF